MTLEEEVYQNLVLLPPGDVEFLARLPREQFSAFAEAYFSIHYPKARSALGDKVEGYFELGAIDEGPCLFGTYRRTE